jgi:hypothetical protein
MVTINFERAKLEEICISNVAIKAMPKEVLAKVNDIVGKLTNNKCHIDQLSCTSSIGGMEDPYLVAIQHTANDVFVKIYEKRLTVNYDNAK